MSNAEKTKVRILRRASGKLQSEVRPIVLEYKERRKKKKRAVEDETDQKYSEGVEAVQPLEGGLLRVARRSTKALSEGLDTYAQGRRRSAKEKKDGAIQDFIDNSAKAASASMKEASEVPVDIAESLGAKSYRKQMRKNLR